jgi:ATP-dependent Clp protease, protease subunit
MRKVQKVAFFNVLLLLFSVVAFENCNAIAKEPRIEIKEKITKRCGVNFFASINNSSVTSLISSVDKHRKNGCSEILINISTNGGSTQAGIIAYNYLSSLSSNITIRTHNISTVASAGVILYCGGRVRTASSNSFFLVHEGTWTFNSNSTYTPSDLDETMKQWLMERKIMRNIFSTCSGISEETTRNLFESRSVFSALDANKNGLVQKITQDMPDFTEDLITIFQ